MSEYSDAIAKAKAQMAQQRGKDVTPPLGSTEPRELSVGGADEITVGGGNSPAHQDFSEVIAHATAGDGEGYQPGAPAGQKAGKTKRTRSSPMGKKDDKEFTHFAKVEKIEHGVVFGWAIVCKKDGVDYIDLQKDHIPEESMLDAAADFAKAARPGNEMHAGPEVGQYLFLFPMTGDIAKALGIETKTTGLLVGYKPPADVLAKFKDGTYTGFSIEGSRLIDEEVEDGT